MTLCRLIAPLWLLEQNSSISKALEGRFTDEQIANFNAMGYNIYYWPNYPSQYSGTTVNGTHIDTFNYVFVDCDLKDGVYESKDAFLSKVGDIGIMPTEVVDSGNGIHVYWKVSSLDAMSYLRFQRRLMRLFDTDEAVQTLAQLMRLPGTVNTKNDNNFIPCEYLITDGPEYTAEELNQLLPPILMEDETYCKDHYNRVYGINQTHTSISDTIPPKFGKLLRDNAEAKDLWAGRATDRSKNDFRLGHLMFANGFTKDEALSVLINSAKALQRAPVHRASYAENIVNKIWTFEAAPAEEKAAMNLSPTVRDILSKGESAIKGTRFSCNRLIDDTVHGYRLGQVIGVVGGSGTGKTTLTLNKFLWFAENNPDYHHFFFSLEQPVGELAARIRTICDGNDALYDKIHLVSNYADDGTYKHMSLPDIETHVQDWQKTTGLKAGAVVIDHIGVLKKTIKGSGENDGLIGICQLMKSVAVNCNVMLIMLSQAPREKAGIGDLELDKSAAYGTVFFESFVDYLICLWQPLKRGYAKGAPTVMAIKFAKIRHKKQNEDVIKEDVCYQLYFDPNNEHIRELTQDEETAAAYWLIQTTNMRKQDRKTDLIKYESRKTTEVVNVSPTPEGNRHSTRH